MARLIDADKIEPTEIYNGEWVRVAYMDDIDELPTVDAEPVVRCKDCKYADEYAMCGRVEWYNKPDDFCSRGERREDAKTN